MTKKDLVISHMINHIAREDVARLRSTTEDLLTPRAGAKREAKDTIHGSNRRSKSLEVLINIIQIDN